MAINCLAKFQFRGCSHRRELFEPSFPIRREVSPSFVIVIFINLISYPVIEWHAMMQHCDFVKYLLVCSHLLKSPNSFDLDYIRQFKIKLMKLLFDKSINLLIMPRIFFRLELWQQRLIFNWSILKEAEL